MNDETEEMHSGQERNRYIEGKEIQTRTHRVKEVCDRALPDYSCKTDETQE